MCHDLRFVVAGESLWVKIVVVLLKRMNELNVCIRIR